MMENGSFTPEIPVVVPVIGDADRLLHYGRGVDIATLQRLQKHVHPTLFSEHHYWQLCANVPPLIGCACIIELNKEVIFSLSEQNGVPRDMVPDPMLKPIEVIETPHPLHVFNPIAGEFIPSGITVTRMFMKPSPHWGGKPFGVTLEASVPGTFIVRQRDYPDKEPMTILDKILNTSPNYVFHEHLENYLPRSVSAPSNGAMNAIRGLFMEQFYRWFPGDEYYHHGLFRLMEAVGHPVDPAKVTLTSYLTESCAV